MHLNYCTKHPDKETYICQKCGRILCDECHPLESRHDITKNEHAGNVCPDCVKAHEVFKRMEHPDAQGRVPVSVAELASCFTRLSPGQPRDYE